MPGPGPGPEFVVAAAASAAAAAAASAAASAAATVAYLPSLLSSRSCQHAHLTCPSAAKLGPEDTPDHGCLTCSHISHQPKRQTSQKRLQNCLPEPLNGRQPPRDESWTTACGPHSTHHQPRPREQIEVCEAGSTTGPLQRSLSANKRRQVDNSLPNFHHYPTPLGQAYTNSKGTSRRAESVNSFSSESTHQSLPQEQQAPTPDTITTPRPSYRGHTHTFSSGSVNSYSTRTTVSSASTAITSPSRASDRFSSTKNPPLSRSLSLRPLALLSPGTEIQSRPTRFSPPIPLNLNGSAGKRSTSTSPVPANPAQQQEPNGAKYRAEVESDSDSSLYSDLESPHHRPAVLGEPSPVESIWPYVVPASDNKDPSTSSDRLADTPDEMVSHSRQSSENGSKKFKRATTSVFQGEYLPKAVEPSHMSESTDSRRTYQSSAAKTYETPASSVSSYPQTVSQYSDLSTSQARSAARQPIVNPGLQYSTDGSSVNPADALVYLFSGAPQPSSNSVGGNPVSSPSFVAPRAPPPVPAQKVDESIYSRQTDGQSYGASPSVSNGSRQPGMHSSTGRRGLVHQPMFPPIKEDDRSDLGSVAGSTMSQPVAGAREIRPQGSMLAPPGSSIQSRDPARSALDESGTPFSDLFHQMRSPDGSTGPPGSMSTSSFFPYLEMMPPYDNFSMFSMPNSTTVASSQGDFGKGHSSTAYGTVLSSPTGQKEKYVKEAAPAWKRGGKWGKPPKSDSDDDSGSDDEPNQRNSYHAFHTPSTEGKPSQQNTNNISPDDGWSSSEVLAGRRVGKDSQSIHSEMTAENPRGAASFMNERAISPPPTTAADLGESGQSEKEKKKKNKFLIWSIVGGVLAVGAIVAIIVVAVLMSKKKSDSGSSSTSGAGSGSTSTVSSGSGNSRRSSVEWANLTGFPAMPIGTFAFATAQLSQARSGCVNPSSMWSCSVPKDARRENSNGTTTAGSPDRPKLQFVVQFDERSGLEGAERADGEGEGAGRRSRRDVFGLSAMTTFAEKIQSLTTIRAKDEGEAPTENLLFRPSPDPPTDQDRDFLGKTTDNVTEPYGGIKTPFYINVLPQVSVGDDGGDDDGEGEGGKEDSEPTDGKRRRASRVRRQEDDDDDDKIKATPTRPADVFTKTMSQPRPTGSGSSNPLRYLIPAPATEADGRAGLANLFPDRMVNQPVRLYNQGRADEHYAFYSYYDRSIFLRSLGMVNPFEPGEGIPSGDRDGGSARDGATTRCTWAQTRVLVQIWTGEGQAQARPVGEEEGRRQTGFPYPVSVTVDRHGGEPAKKGVYCYGLDERSRIVPDSGVFYVEDRAFGGTIERGQENVFEEVEVDVEKGGEGGMDGGSGGCLCRWDNFL